MAYTQQVAMCLSDKVTLCTSFNTGPAYTGRIVTTQQLNMQVQTLAEADV